MTALIGPHRGRAVGLALAAALILPGVAHGSTASVAGSTLDYTAEPNEPNVAVVSLAAGTYTITDTGAPITAGAGCAPVNANEVSCADTGITSLTISLDDLDDDLTSTAATPASVSGGTGADALEVGGGDDTLNGDAGDDILLAGTGADNLNGGAGTNDTTSYVERTEAVTASIGDGANDGEAGEGDDIDAEIEVVAGGSGNDTLIGDGNDNGLYGMAGDDQLFGLAANDVLVGGEDTDEMNGAAGSDQLVGGPGADVHNGGTGNTVDGFPGNDFALYDERSAAVTVTIDDVADDGEAAEGDDVRSDIEAVLGGMDDDTLTANPAGSLLNGGGGSDTLNGGDGPDTLLGEAGVPGPPGDDTLNGGAGDDYLRGGDDSLVGSDDDVLNGGDGTDLADYPYGPTSVDVSLDGVANDGAVGETDNVQTDVEDLRGSLGDDTLTGNSSPNMLDGVTGDDTLTGADGDDELLGDFGDDDLHGDAGNDVLAGADDDDTLDGGTDTDRATYADAFGAVAVDLSVAGPQDTGGDGIDTLAGIEDLTGSLFGDTLTGDDNPNALEGGFGVDTLAGEGEDDNLDVRDGGPDNASCGAGVDDVVADTLGTDTIAGDCEGIDYEPTPPPPAVPTVPTPPLSTAPAVISPTQGTATKKKKCRRGFKLKKVKGKRKCVKTKRKRRR